MDKLKFEDLPAAMTEALERLQDLQEELQNIKENLQPKEPDELMTRREVADYLKVDLSTVWNWSKRGTLPYYGIGKRVYYKRSDVQKALIKIKTLH